MAWSALVNGVIDDKVGERQVEAGRVEAIAYLTSN